MMRSRLSLPIITFTLFGCACGASSHATEATARTTPASSATPVAPQDRSIANAALVGPHTLPTIVWRAQTGGRIVASATEVSPAGEIVVGSLDGSLYRFTADGVLVYRLDTGAPIRSRALAIADDQVVAANEAGAVLRVNAVGSVIWRAQLSAGIATDPISGPDGLVYVAADGIYAIDQDGVVHWHHVEATTLYEQPVIHPEGQLVFGTVDGRVVTLGYDGQVRATRRKAPDEPIQPRIPPRDQYGISYVVGADQMLRATREDGSELWGYNLGANVAGNVLLTSSGTLLLGTDDGTLYALH